jgi:hypothetical protein
MKRRRIDPQTDQKIRCMIAEGYSNKEIAEKLDIPLYCVRSRREDVKKNKREYMIKYRKNKKYYNTDYNTDKEWKELYNIVNGNGVSYNYRENTYMCIIKVLNNYNDKVKYGIVKNKVEKTYLLDFKPLTFYKKLSKLVKNGIVEKSEFDMYKLTERGRDIAKKLFETN